MGTSLCTLGHSLQTRFSIYGRTLCVVVMPRPHNSIDIHSANQPHYIFKFQGRYAYYGTNWLLFTVTCALWWTIISSDITPKAWSSFDTWELTDSSGRGLIRCQCRYLAIILWTKVLSSKVDGGGVGGLHLFRSFLSNPRHRLLVQRSVTLPSLSWLGRWSQNVNCLVLRSPLSSCFCWWRSCV